MPVSALTAWITRWPLPKSLRSPLIQFVFGRLFRADVSEAEAPLESYPTLVAFFSRRLKPGLRTFASWSTQVLSPCDGTLTGVQKIEDGTLFQAKGMPYALRDFLGSQDPTPFQNGTAVTIYLAPKDYHRVHVPLSARLLRAERLRGSVYPVNAFTTHRVPGVFSKNRRLIFSFETVTGEFYGLCMVAALNVSRMPVTFDLAWGNQKGIREYQKDLEQGEDLAAFELGSTVVLLFPAGAFQGTAHPGKIRAGQPLGNWFPVAKSISH